MPDHAPRPAGRRIALIAHDNKKRDMLEWAEYNLDLLAGHDLSATATTGHLLQQQLGLPVTCFRSGPYGGDQRRSHQAQDPADGQARHNQAVVSAARAG
jgi:methylglyoxal synthase